MSEPNPHPWSCVACKGIDHFVITVDRLLHVTRGHLANVVDADGNVIMFASPGVLA